jgi:surface protein
MKIAFSRTFALLLSCLLLCALLPVPQGNASGAAVVTHSGTVGIGGAPWRLYSDGTLVVDGGFIEWDGRFSPWDEHFDIINKIIFTGPINCGDSLSGLFFGLYNVTVINGLHHFDTRNVTDMSGMFEMASSLTSLDLSGWDTSNVVDMSFMFYTAVSLTSLDLSGWETGNVVNMRFMFFDAHKLTSLDVSGWDTGNVIHMDAMFDGAVSLTSLDLTGWDTSNVTDMGFMFCNASSIESLDLSGWDTSNVVDMHSMFRNAFSLISLDLSGWDTRSVLSINNMFQGTHNLRRLVLSENFSFGSFPSLPNVPENEYFTGLWRNVGTGTVTRPKGEHVLTSGELMLLYDGAAIADTWVWQTTFTPGHVLDRGTVTVADASLAFRGLLGLTDLTYAQERAAALDGTALTIGHVLRIFRYALGLSESL